MAKKEKTDLDNPPQLPDWRNDPALIEAEARHRGLEGRIAWIDDEVPRVKAVVESERKQLEDWAKQNVDDLATGAAGRLSPRPSSPVDVGALEKDLADYAFEREIFLEAKAKNLDQIPGFRARAFQKARDAVIGWTDGVRRKAIRQIYELRESLFSEQDFLDALALEGKEAGVSVSTNSPLAVFRQKLYRLLVDWLVSATENADPLVDDDFVKATIMAGVIGNEVRGIVRQNTLAAAAMTAAHSAKPPIAPPPSKTYALHDIGELPAWMPFEAKQYLAGQS